VSTGQAGQTVNCRCGAPVEVPTIRELRDLQPAASEAGEAPAWGRRQGFFFVGIAIAALALIAIGAIWVTQPKLVDIRAEVGEPDAAALLAEVKATSPDENYMRYEAIRPWPPTLFAQREGVPSYLLASQELIKGFEGNGNSFLTPHAARPILEKIQQRSNENLYALHERKQRKDWIVILAVAAGVGLVIAAAGLLVPAESPKRKRVPQAS